MATGIRWLGTTEAADMLGVVPRTLYRLIDEGRLPAYRMGRVYRIKESDLDAFIESTRVQPGELAHLYVTDDASDIDEVHPAPSRSSAE